MPALFESATTTKKEIRNKLTEDSCKAVHIENNCMKTHINKKNMFFEVKSKNPLNVSYNNEIAHFTFMILHKIVMLFPLLS